MLTFIELFQEFFNKVVRRVEHFLHSSRACAWDTSLCLVKQRVRERLASKVVVQTKQDAEKEQERKDHTHGCSCRIRDPAVEKRATVCTGIYPVRTPSFYGFPWVHSRARSVFILMGEHSHSSRQGAAWRRRTWFYLSIHPGNLALSSHRNSVQSQDDCEKRQRSW